MPKRCSNRSIPHKAKRVGRSTISCYRLLSLVMFHPGKGSSDSRRQIRPVRVAIAMVVLYMGQALLDRQSGS